MIKWNMTKAAGWGLCPLTSIWFAVEDQRIHARVSTGPAPPGAPPVVLVHGLVVSGRYLVPLARQLGAYFPTYVPDLPGFGKSSKPRRVYGLSRLADTLAAWIDAAGLDRPVLLGNSFGCQIIAEMVVRHPDRASRLILQAPTIDQTARNTPQQVLRFLQNSLHEPPMLLPIMLMDYWQAGFRRAVETLLTALGDRIEAKLPLIDLPALVVSGAKDAMARQAWTRELACRLPQGRHTVLPGAAHTAVFSTPADVAFVARRFIGDAPVPAELPPLEPAPPFLADFDSASGMLRATGRMLRGQDFAAVGIPKSQEMMLKAAGHLPMAGRETLYSLGGWQEAVRAGTLDSINLEELSRWTTRQYPKDRYPALFLGSANGAAVHLFAALDAPWLPQTFLVPVRRLRGRVNDMAGAMRWGEAPGRKLLAANPHFQLHHMHDPAQDHLMAACMAYFRVKRRRLGEAYGRFIEERLEPGGTLFVLECGQTWPSVQVAANHFFQPGAVGGLGPEDYLGKNEAVRKFLRQRGAERLSWGGIEPDGERPEAEWGFEPALLDDIQAVARRRGLQVVRIQFQGPQAISPLVAEFYRHWYAREGIPANRLLVESFILLEPWWTLRTRSVPFWTVFPVRPALEGLKNYLAQTDPFDFISLMLFSHGVNSPGLAPLEEWRSVLASARTRGDFIGVDERAYPRDFGIFGRYHADLQEKIDVRHPLPEPFGVDRFKAYLQDAAGRHGVAVRFD